MVLSQWGDGPLSVGRWTSLSGEMVLSQWGDGPLSVGRWSSLSGEMVLSQWGDGPLSMGRWSSLGQEYTEELYKKDLHDPDNHDGVITHLKPDVREGEVKWALESITTN